MRVLKNATTTGYLGGDYGKDAAATVIKVVSRLRIPSLGGSRRVGRWDRSEKLGSRG